MQEQEEHGKVWQADGFKPSHCKATPPTPADVIGGFKSLVQVRLSNCYRSEYFLWFNQVMKICLHLLSDETSSVQV